MLVGLHDRHTFDTKIRASMTLLKGLEEESDEFLETTSHSPMIHFLLSPLLCTKLTIRKLLHLLLTVKPYYVFRVWQNCCSSYSWLMNQKAAKYTSSTMIWVNKMDISYRACLSDQFLIHVSWECVWKVDSKSDLESCLPVKEGIVRLVFYYLLHSVNGWSGQEQGQSKNL